MRTWARVFKPPTVAAWRRMSYVERKNVLPLLNWSSRTPSSTSPMKTNKPTFHSRRDLSIVRSRVLSYRKRGHHFGIVQVASINDDGILEFLAEAVEIEVGEFLPLREDEQSVGAVGRLVSGVGEGDVGRDYFLGALHGGWIVGGDLTALLQERLHKKECGRFADIVGTSLESEAEHAEVLAAQRPESAADFA